MKVKTIIPIMERILDIARCYEDKSFKEMFDDIYFQVSNEKNTRVNKVNSVNNVPLDINDMIGNLENRNKEEVVIYLRNLNKKDLSTLSKAVGLKVRKEATKEVFIETIANHFSFINLNNQISNRNIIKTEGIRIEENRS